jgi:secreted trypsin-like serine protease
MASRLAKLHNGRIVGGVKIPIEAIPFQVSLQLYGYQICGGSIISKQYILTAAHCKLNK